MKVKTTCKGIKFVYNEYRTKLAKGEDNDCAVRASCRAFNIPYDLAHRWVADTFERKHRKPTYYFAEILEETTRAFGHAIIDLRRKSLALAGERGVYTYSREKLYQIEHDMSVKTLLKKYSQGTYFVVLTDHVFTLVDGVIYGNPEDALRIKRHVKALFLIKNLVVRS